MKLEERTFGTPCTIFRLYSSNPTIAQPYTSAVHGQQYLRARECTLSSLLFFDHGYISFWNCRHCRRCKKRRSLRSNSFFEEFPRISLAKLLLCIYFFVEDDSQKSASRKVGLTKNKTSQIYRRLEDVCTVDLEYNPITPFGGPGIVVKCDESKFNHKAKVSNIFLKK